MYNLRGYYANLVNDIDINVYSHLFAYTKVKVVNFQYLLFYWIKNRFWLSKSQKRYFKFQKIYTIVRW